MKYNLYQEINLTNSSVILRTEECHSKISTYLQENQITPITSSTKLYNPEIKKLSNEQLYHPTGGIHVHIKS